MDLESWKDELIDEKSPPLQSINKILTAANGKYQFKCSGKRNLKAIVKTIRKKQTIRKTIKEILFNGNEYKKYVSKVKANRTAAVNKD